MNPLRNEKGFSVLLLALMVLLVMTALGSAMLMTSQREIKSVNKLTLSTQAFYSAESGVALAIAEINNGSLAEFNAVIEDMKLGNAPTDGIMLYDSDYPSLNMRFDTKIEFLGADPICYGDIDGDFDYEQDTFSNFITAHQNSEVSERIAGKHFWPVLKITSTGRDGNNPNDLFKYAERNVQVQIRLEPSFEFPQAALTLNGNLTGHGQPNAIVGEGHPDEVEHCSVSDIVGTNPTVNIYDGDTDLCEDPPGSGTFETCTDSPEIVDDAAPYPVARVISILRTMATTIDLSNGDKYNGDSNTIYYHEGDAGPVNNLEGRGILVINGTLDVGGNIDWDGLIIIAGDMTSNGGGADINYIHGSVIVGGNATLNGNPDIFFDCDYLLELWESTGKFHKLWWQEIKGRIDL